MIELAFSTSNLDHYTHSFESLEATFEPFDSDLINTKQGEHQHKRPFEEDFSDSPLPFYDMEGGYSHGEASSNNPQAWSSHASQNSWHDLNFQQASSSSSSLSGHHSQTPCAASSSAAASADSKQQASASGSVPRRYTIQNAAASSSMISLMPSHGYTEATAPNPAMHYQSTAMGAPTSQPQYSASSASSIQGCFCAILGQQCTCPKSRPRFYTMSAASTSSNTQPLVGHSPSTGAAAFASISPQHTHDAKRRNLGQHLSLEPESLVSSWSQMGREETSMYHSAEHSRFHSPAFSQPSHYSASPLVYPSGLTSQSPIGHHQDLSYLYDSIGMTTPGTPTTSAATHLSTPTATAFTSNSDAEMPLKTESPELSSLHLHRPFPHRLAMSHSQSQHAPQAYSPLAHPSYHHQHQQYQNRGFNLPLWPTRSDTMSSAYSTDHSNVSQAPSESYATSITPASTTRSHIRSDTTTTSTSMISASSTASRQTMGDDIGLVTSGSGSSLNRFATDDDRWEAIVHRSHAADSHFVYGALTTRIYCRPSCASKRPDRNRVVLFDFPDAPVKAEYAGFRACKRCKPGMPGTVDACVLAVGQCLRHITQAALLGESDEVDTRLKKRTLKEYSSDYGVSAFHFHRTLKNVCTLTPGDYSKACHALVLQDEIGMDKKDGEPLDAEELQLKLRGWSSRRARRAVGNILPSTYSQGFLGMKMFCIYAPDTSFGNIAVLYSKGTETLMDHVAHPLDTDAYSNAHCTVYTVITGDDALSRLQKRAPNAVQVAEQSDWLRSLVEELARKGSREVQMPVEVIPWVRRARVWLAVKTAMEPKSRNSGKKRSSNTDEGDDEEDEDDFDLEETSLGSIAAV